MFKNVVYTICFLFAAATIFAMSPQTGSDDGKGPKKDATCDYLGCTGGTQPCADYTVHLDGGIPGVIEGGGEVTYHCYQKVRESKQKKLSPSAN